MCTVTFIPAGNKVFITSNRDEKSTRAPAIAPAIKSHTNGILLYPVDGDKGGTWVITRQNGDTGVLLNGAAVPHLPQPPYKESRGLLLVRIMQQKYPLAFFNSYDCTGIEPFTLILYCNRVLNECRWNGHLKTIVSLNKLQPHIWSSSTLYGPGEMAKRSGWFDKWIKHQSQLTADDILHFHSTAGEGDPANDLLMNRGGKTYTISITCVEITGQSICMYYNDLFQKKRYKQWLSSPARQYIALQKQRWQRMTTRVRNWEYWPFGIFYLPVYFYWFWLCLRARSFFFFSAANPTIRNGGFLMESKKEIYDLLPTGTYPATALVYAKASEEEVTEALEAAGITYPMIAKPDIGLRGMGVALLHHRQALSAYLAPAQVTILLQQYVPYLYEAGIFYYRFPGQKHGTITGIVGKQFLKVTGTGLHTVEELLALEPRFALQIPALRKYKAGELSEVLEKGAERLVVPFGNHCRGTMFLDHTHLLNSRVAEVIDNICRQVKGFYFGRLDVKFESWSDLAEGKNFSIIELNGAGSEPAHIYDPKHSIFFGWREVMRHLHILYQISMQNRRFKKAPFLTMKEGLQMFRDNRQHEKRIA